MNVGITNQTPQAVFFDRDGTLIEHVPYLSDPSRVVLLPGVKDALRYLQAAAVRLFLFSNQSGVGRGLFTMADVEAVNQRMVELLELGPRPFAGICIAPELPDAPSRYRKPSPHFIHETLDRHGIPASAAWMVGDSPVDWEAGIAAGVRTAAISSPHRVGPPRASPGDYGVESYDSVLEWLDVCWSR